MWHRKNATLPMMMLSSAMKDASVSGYTISFPPDSPFAEIVVGFTFQEEGYTGCNERSETLPSRTFE
jgi:hypothetical protein